MKFILILLILITFQVQAQENLSTSQLKIKNIAKSVGKTICTEDICFSKTLQAIAWQESSFGLNRVGDSGVSLGAFQVKISTAKWIIIKLELKEYYYIIGDNWLIGVKLLNDHWFSARIAGFYLKMNYIYGIEQDHWNPWVLTVSRYNGGNFNKVYLNNIINKIKKLI